MLCYSNGTDNYGTTVQCIAFRGETVNIVLTATSTIRHYPHTESSDLRVFHYLLRLRSCIYTSAKSIVVVAC